MDDVEDFLIAQTMLQNATMKDNKNLSIEAFVLKNGRYFKPAPLPKGIPHGDVNNCFKNAFVLAVKNKTRYLYCEGFASSGLIPLIHAWVVDRKGRVIDPTWCPDGTNNKMEYYGIPFDWDYVTRQFKDMKHFGFINDTKRKWSLLREEKNEFKSKWRFER